MFYPKDQPGTFSAPPPAPRSTLAQGSLTEAQVLLRDYIIAADRDIVLKISPVQDGDQPNREDYVMLGQLTTIMSEKRLIITTDDFKCPICAEHVRTNRSKFVSDALPRFLE